MPPIRQRERVGIGCRHTRIDDQGPAEVMLSSHHTKASDACGRSGINHLLTRIVDPFSHDLEAAMKTFFNDLLPDPLVALVCAQAGAIAALLWRIVS